MPRGPKPKPEGQKVTRTKMEHPWQHAEGEGWQHGDVPACPEGLTVAGQEAWRTWLSSWWASFYTPDDLPGLALTVKVYDGVMGGHLDPAKVTGLLDKFGITPKGRQDLRWARAKQADAKPETSSGGRRLRVVDAS